MRHTADELIKQALDEKALVSTNNHSARSAVKSLRGGPSKAKSKRSKPSELQMLHRFQKAKPKPRKEHEDIEAADVHGKIKFRVLTRAHQKELFPK